MLTALPRRPAPPKISVRTPRIQNLTAMVMLRLMIKSHGENDDEGINNHDYDGDDSSYDNDADVKK